jgi:hypothetical protein
MIKSFALLVLVSLSANAYASTTASQVVDGNAQIDQLATEQQAKSIAEQFIKNQGYTSAPSPLPKDEIVFESIEWEVGVDEILKSRRGTLEPEAVGAIQSEEGWIVGFRYANAPPEADTGRGVTMDRYGQHMRVMHEDLLLSHVSESPLMVEDAIYESLRRYESADPEEDLRKAVSKNDYRFMFVCSYACEAPGVDDYHDKYSQQYAYVTIDDTGDYLLNSEHSRLKMIVQAYAEKYNKLLIEEIEKKAQR